MMAPISLISAMENYFYKNYRQHLLADDLQIRAKKMMTCFSDSFLPLPNENLNATWGELPNNTMDVMPMSFKADMIFLRAPPPTPMDGAFPVNEGSNNTLACNRSDNEGSLLLYETESCPTPGLATFAIVDLDLPDVPHPPKRDMDDNDPLRCDPGEGQLDNPDSGIVLDHPQNSDRALSTSDADGVSLRRRDLPIPPVKFQELVDSSISEIHARGIEPFVESLLISGVETVQAATAVSFIAHGIIKQLFQQSYTEARDLSGAIRIGTMEMFRQHWKADGDWIEVSSTSRKHSFLTLRGVNKAGLMGSLFNAKVVSAEDVSLCLSLLLEGEKHFDRLCAMHALLVQANDKLCKSRNLPILMEFRAQLTAKDIVSGLYKWAPASPAVTILQDILDTIDGWMDTQAIKRMRYQAATKSRAVPPQAVGPRLRGGS